MMEITEKLTTYINLALEWLILIKEIGNLESANVEDIDFPIERLSFVLKELRNSKAVIVTIEEVT